MFTSRKTRIILPFLLFLTYACSTTQKNTYWVSGLKTTCDAGAGQLTCLQVHTGDELADAQWENFYSPIEGFQIEEGVIKKIEVKVDKRKETPVPADASSLQYTFVKELERHTDNRVLASGKWIASQLYLRPLNKMVTLPTVEISAVEMRVSGNNGCNNFFGQIHNFTNRDIEFKPLAQTEKACLDENLEAEFNTVLAAVRSYEIKNNQLIFYDDDGQNLASFMNALTTEEPNANIEGAWTTARIAGKPINKMVSVPTLNITPKKMAISGSDGCNVFGGEIKEFSVQKLVFGDLMGTLRACEDMDVPDRFNLALTQVSSYLYSENELTFFDNEGNEVLFFIR